MRFATIAVWVPLFLIPFVSPASARSLTWETWGENAVAASASEGTHAWITHGLYERGTEVGMGKWQAAGTAMGIMLVWEVVEVKGMDALGVSVQDLAANSLGILAGVAGLGVNYQYVTFSNPPEHDKVWMNIPCAPRNDMSYSFELQSGQVTAGVKYLGAVRGDMVIGSASMPVHTGETGDSRLIPYMGYKWKSGWHAAAGYDGVSENVMVGGGFALSVASVGADITALLAEGDLSFGLGVFANYDSIF